MANNATIPNETKPNVNTPEREPRTKNKRNYKKILKRTGAVVATAAVIFTLAMAPGAVNAHKEAINADSLVEFYLDGQNGVTIGTKPSESEEETSIDRVFGGGKGKQTTITGKTNVNIKDMAADQIGKRLFV